MFNHDLIEKYIYEISKYIPYKQREDVLKEIRSIINDMLEERCKELSPTDKDVRVVLAELGTPEELGVEYNQDKTTSLISGEYFIKYKLALKIILAAVAIGLTVATVLNIVLNDVIIAYSLYELMLKLISVSVSIIGATTIVFAILERKAISLNDFDIDKLPKPPNKEEKIKVSTSVISIVINTLITIVLLVAPEIVEFAFSYEANTITIFNAEFIKSAWAVILTIGVVGVFDDVVKLIEAKYTKKVMISTIISNTVAMVGMFYLFSNNKIYSDIFIIHISKIGMDRYISFYPFIIVAFILIDTIVTVMKTLKLEKQKDNA